MVTCIWAYFIALFSNFVNIIPITIFVFNQTKVATMSQTTKEAEKRVKCSYFSKRNAILNKYQKTVNQFYIFCNKVSKLIKSNFHLKNGTLFPKSIQILGKNIFLFSPQDILIPFKHPVVAVFLLPINSMKGKWSTKKQKLIFLINIF